MNHFKRAVILCSVIVISAGTYAQMSILSGPKKGSYNQFVTDIVTIVGQNNGLKISNRATAGSAYNFRMLTNPSSNDKIALIQSDYLNQMIAEDKLNNTNKTGSLRVVLELATEQIQIIAKKSSGLKSLQDLEKKNVGFGTKDQGSYVTASMIKARSGINWYSFDTSFEEMLKKLANGTIDAGIIVGSAPVNMLDIDPQAMTDGISLFTLTDFNGWARYYENDTVYQSDYKWLDHDVPTFGVRTLLVVNDTKLTDADKKTVAAIKSGIISNLDLLKKQGHPRWKTVLIPDDAEVVTNNTSTSPTITTTNNDAVVYRVQVYSRSYERNAETVTIGNQNYNAFVYQYKGAFRYAVGEFATYTEALAFQKNCRTSGYPDAFVVAFKGGVRTNDPALLK